MKNYQIQKILIENKLLIEELGIELYNKFSSRPKEDNITEKDCIDYMINLVISRTFDGYMTEIVTIYGQLENILKIKIEPAPDKWDRLFNIDFYIKIDEKYIGLQIKPVNDKIQLPEIFKEKLIQANTHKKFTKDFGGQVFYIFSAKINGKKEIVNIEVIEDIRLEIERLKNI